MKCRDLPNSICPKKTFLAVFGSELTLLMVSSADKDFLLRRFHELDAEVSRLRYPLSPAPTHGDAHVQNLMFCDDQPVLIDFERFAWGQPEWDISMTATEYQTAGWWTDAEYQSFTEAYGYDVTSWTEGFPVLRAVHEIKMTTWLMQNVKESPEIAREYETRMQTIRGGATTALAAILRGALQQQTWIGLGQNPGKLTYCWVGSMLLRKRLVKIRDVSYVTARL